ncbi:hypothetical protein GYMLUDRAFT_86240 [Collybiopsis luxurians FD-317 M1]|uniref:Uncharacterized protein n=1 Tax=Collybiopsis luxurians FD-317 M1 TaxID=944289 RepID=A0A0D0BTC1_9AGAR|nr:hypothetical protein GYMLUDRAFT_86240 [Collybiopsis luxurians FD-317 M1]
MADSSEPVYQKARMAVLKHAATQVLVENGEYAIERWAQEFAEHRARYEKVTSIIHPNVYPGEIDPRVQTILGEVDAFIRARASSRWEGNWVDPQWRKAALERDKNDRERCAELVLESLEVEFNYPEDDLMDSKIEYEEDRQELKPQINPKPAQGKGTRRVMDSVEIATIPKRLKSPSATPSHSMSPLSRRNSARANITPKQLKRTRSQMSLKKHRVTSLVGATAARL